MHADTPGLSPERRLGAEFPPDKLPSVRELLATNIVGEVPAHMFEDHPGNLGIADVPVEHYTSQAFHDLEVQHVWKKVWQFTCLEKDIPNVGDYYIYEIAEIEIMIVRSGIDEFSAFYNSCLHRGEALRNESGNAKEFRCPFHGWCFTLKGELSEVPAQWDFPHVTPGKHRIRQIQVDTWDGFIFINMDAEADSLADYLRPLPEHFATWNYTNRWRGAWIGKVIKCNWKAAQEAFLEGYHAPTTHPQQVLMSQQYELQYDILSDHVSRMLACNASPNFMTGPDVSEQDLADYYTDGTGMKPISVPEGRTARQELAQQVREGADAYVKNFGADYAEVSDPEVFEAFPYSVFPNFALFGGYGQPLTYRFRPNGNDPGSCLMEIVLYFPVDSDAPARANVPMHLLGEDEPFSAAPELGMLGLVMDQDTGVMEAIGRGSRTTQEAGFIFSNYQESRIRHIHQSIDAYISWGTAATGSDV